VRYDGTWRDRDPAEAPPGVPPVIRLKTPQRGSTGDQATFGHIFCRLYPLTVLAQQDSPKGLIFGKGEARFHALFDAKV
jgi:hypothetical protein